MANCMLSYFKEWLWPPWPPACTPDQSAAANVEAGPPTNKKMTR